MSRRVINRWSCLFGCFFMFYNRFFFLCLPIFLLLLLSTPFWFCLKLLQKRFGKGKKFITTLPSFKNYLSSCNKTDPRGWMEMMSERRNARIWILQKVRGMKISEKERERESKAERKGNRINLVFRKLFSITSNVNVWIQILNFQREEREKEEWEEEEEEEGERSNKGKEKEEWEEL